MKVRVGFVRAGFSGAAALLGATAFVLGGSAAWAAAVPSAYPPPVVGLQLSTSVATPGSTIGVTGEGWAPGTTETISIMSAPVVLGTTTANSQGDFSTSVTIPLNTALGAHQIVATGPSGANPAEPLTLSANLTVVASTAAQPTAAAAQPFTGWDTRAPLLASLALVVLGSAAVLVARNRRQRRHA